MIKTVDDGMVVDKIGLVLSGGFSESTWKYGIRQKALAVVEMDGKQDTLLSHQINRLKLLGLKDIVVIAGWMGDAVIKEVKRKHSDVLCVYVYPNGVGEALDQFASFFRKEDRGVVCVGVSDFYGLDDLKILTELDGNAMLVSDVNITPKRKRCMYEVVDGVVKRVIGVDGDAGVYEVGAYAFDLNAVRDAREICMFVDYCDVIGALLSLNKTVSAVHVNKWISFDDLDVLRKRVIAVSESM